jgi:hypothetical protein
MLQPSYPDPFWSHVYANLFSDMFGSTDAAARSRRTARRAHNIPEPNAFAQFCGRQANDLARWPLDGIEQAVKPTGEQQHRLADLKTTAQEAANALQDACPRETPRSPTERLDLADQAMAAMLHAVSRVRPPLEAFFASLDDEQKARLTATLSPAARAESRSRKHVSGDHVCGPVTRDLLAARFERITRRARLTGNQLGALEKLWNASADAAAMLQDFCKPETALTPTGRLGAMQQRLEAMRNAIATIKPALAGFYGSLSDAQKAQLATMG